jgi:protein-ribulosamine 3-kinase
VFEIDRKKHPPWLDYEICAQLVLDKCIPRLLGALQSQGRSIKPCLVHGNIWDENTATDMETGEPFVFDGSAFYAHNEYELGNWRSPRHRLSSKTYIRSYKRHFPASEPGKLDLSTSPLPALAKFET